MHTKQKFGTQENKLFGQGGQQILWGDLCPSLVAPLFRHFGDCHRPSMQVRKKKKESSEISRDLTASLRDLRGVYITVGAFHWNLFESTSHSTAQAVSVEWKKLRSVQASATQEERPASSTFVTTLDRKGKSQERKSPLRSQKLPSWRRISLASDSHFLVSTATVNFKATANELFINCSHLCVWLVKKLAVSPKHTHTIFCSFFLVWHALVKVWKFATSFACVSQLACSCANSNYLSNYTIDTCQWTLTMAL